MLAMPFARTAAIYACGMTRRFTSSTCSISCTEFEPKGHVFPRKRSSALQWPSRRGGLSFPGGPGRTYVEKRRLRAPARLESVGWSGASPKISSGLVADLAERDEEDGNGPTVGP